MARANKFRDQGIGAAVVMVVMILNNLARGDFWSTLKALVWISCTFVLWITFAVLALRKPKTGKVLLNLGRSKKGRGWLLLFFGLVGSIMLLLGLNISNNVTEQMEALSLGVMAWSVGIVLVLANRRGTLLTAEGVQTGYTGFKWEQVKHYTWASTEKGNHDLFFKIKHRPPLADTSILSIPAEHRQAVSDIVIQHIPQDRGGG